MMSEWIKVSERLPVVGEDVLIFDSSTNLSFIAWRNSVEKWLVGTVYAESAKVTHWMPLPAPPEEK